MSAATVFPDIQNLTLRNLAFTVLNAIRRPDGSQVTGFTDRLGKVVNAASSGQASPAREVEIIIRINPDGMTATAKVIPQALPGLQSQEGVLDPTLLAGVTL